MYCKLVAKMRMSEQVPFANYLPISTLFKLADPYLILKLCTTNKEAYYYSDKCFNEIDAAILQSIKEANFTCLVKRHVFEIYFHYVRFDSINVRMKFLRKVLQYPEFLKVIGREEKDGSFVIADIDMCESFTLRFKKFDHV